MLYFQTVDEKFIEEERKFRAVEKTVKTLLKNISTYLEEFQVRKLLTIWVLYKYARLSA